MTERLKEWLDRPTTRAAAWLVALAVAVMILWRAVDADRVDAWMPNIITGLVALALTITFVESIVRRDRTEREAGRTASAYARLELALLKLMQAVASDYSATHLRTEPDFKWNPVEVIQHWLEDDVDTPRRDPGDGSEPFVLAATLEFADAVKRVVATEHQVLPNDLVALMNEIVEHAARARHMDDSIGYRGLALHLWKAHDVLYYVRFFAEKLRSERHGRRCTATRDSPNGSGLDLGGTGRAQQLTSASSTRS